MNECTFDYCREVVELKAVMERVRAKLESVESMLMYNRASLEEMNKQLQRSRLDVASVKTSAAIWGGLSGAMLAALLKWMFTQM
ncbi:MAG: hypothetical protein P9L94_11540 [Candidatus Hinthialibacter antarcticus]|nr:hypothetical protein [Candidatus Hinthialibacter antarcticus]